MIVKYKYEPRTAIILDPKGESLDVVIKIKDDFFKQPNLNEELEKGQNKTEGTKDDKKDKKEKLNKAFILIGL